MRVTFIHTSDEHSAVLPAPLVDHHGGARGSTRGGFARLATAIRQIRDRARANGEPAVVTSAGDNIGGSPFSWLLLDGLSVELALMVAMGYDVVTLGNHEFDYDAQLLARYIAAAGYPAAAARTAIVATNTHPPPGHPLGELGIVRTHVMEFGNGLRVGFFGLLGRGAARFATLAAPVEFSEAEGAAATAVAELRAAGVHLVVALTHAGVAEDRALARAVSGIDIILGGHDHELIDEPFTEAGTIIVHPGSHARQLFVLEVEYDAGARQVRVRNRETGSPFVVAIDSSVAEDPAIAAQVDTLQRLVEARVARETGGRIVSLEQTVARSGFPLRAGPPLQETTLGNFVTDAMRAAAAAATGVPVDFAFQANGMIRGDLAIGSVPGRAGEIAFHDLATVVGMGRGPGGGAGYPLVSLWLTGAEVRNVLEVSVLLSTVLRNSYYLQPSGLRMRYDPRRAILFRIPFRGTPVPTGRAVLAAERETATGMAPLPRGDTALYHVVTDYYVASFLPMVGRMLPRLALQPKTSDGRPIADIGDAVIMRDGRELPTWLAVLEYAAAQPPGVDGTPHIAAVYAQPAGRLRSERAAPLWLFPLAAFLLFATAAALLLRLWRARRARRAQRGQRPVAGPAPSG
jgi:2',3'-cyclic-nucleotide 2'-phosphodiesterase (5'-nucleotidase family)